MPYCNKTIFIFFLFFAFYSLLNPHLVRDMLCSVESLVTVKCKPHSQVRSCLPLSLLSKTNIMRETSYRVFKEALNDG